MFLRPQEILSLRGAADLDKLEQVGSSNPQPSIASAIADLQQRANFMLHPFSLLMDMFGCGGDAALYSCYDGKVHITVTLYRFRTRLGSGTGFKSLHYFFLSHGQCLPEGDSMSQFCNLRNNDPEYGFQKAKTCSAHRQLESLDVPFYFCFCCAVVGVGIVVAQH